MLKTFSINCLDKSYQYIKFSKKEKTARLVLLMAVIVLTALIMIDAKSSINGLKLMTAIVSMVLIVSAYFVGRFKRKD
jgi:exosortase/archaeosortase